MTYENNISGAEITLHNPEGSTAIGCFWAKRDSQRVLKHVTPDVAVVGNIYHNRFISPYQMELSAHKVARALWWNPQITTLRLVSSDKEELDEFFHQLFKHEGLVLKHEWGAPAGSIYVGFDRLDVNLVRCREKRDYPMPAVTAPETFPYKYPSGHVLRGTDLTKLHADLLRHCLRYGERTGGEKDRLELLNTLCEWREPFSLGSAYKSLEPAWLEYSHLLPHPAGQPAGTPTEELEYTYYSRLSLLHNRRMVSHEDRRGWFPVWLPDDHEHFDAPCLVGIHIRRDSAVGVFRAHNFVDAWSKNMFLVKTIAEEKAGRPMKSVSLLSLQGGIRPEDAKRAQEYVEKYYPEGKPDIHGTGGSWTFEKDGEEGVARLLGPSGILQEIRGKSSLEIRTKITALGAWPPEGSECAYIGDQLGRLFIP